MECLRDLPKLEKFEHEQDPAGITYGTTLADSFCDSDISRLAHRSLLHLPEYPSVHPSVCHILILFSILLEVRLLDL